MPLLEGPAVVIGFAGKWSPKCFHVASSMEDVCPRQQSASAKWRRGEITIKTALYVVHLLISLASTA